MLLGLKTLLKEIMPIADYRIYPNVGTIVKGTDVPNFFHFFITASAFTEAPEFFCRHQRQTIILSDGENEQAVPRTFRRLNALLEPEELLKQLLLTYQHAHHNFNHYPQSIARELVKIDSAHSPSLSAREKDVLVLLAKGYINKQIAQQLNISINTVITHRRNIMKKLHSQSLSKLVIYAVTHSLVSADDIL